ncbi:flavoprotein [Rhizohabitans arisaemae]|uniref:flavoprotein n=1 Tax=Rhizohabitans arisaemae TaxID=2720610 RepID=UPI0024B1D66D|nr:flavoprotein [Rhizohabitans arisaemae]
MTSAGKVLYLVVCGAGPAGEIGTLVGLARQHGWIPQVVATPAALAFIDVPELERLTGRPIRSRYRSPDEPKPPRADAVIVAPATFNTINKFAQGIADTYALGVLAEAVGLGIPVVVLPFVNSALAGRLPFRQSVDRLREEGVSILLGPGAFEPHPPNGEAAPPPWHLTLTELARLSAKPHK